MSVANGFGGVQPKDHERGGVGVCRGTILSYDGSRKDVVLDGIARARVDGMRVFLSVLIVEVAVVPRCGKPCIRNLEYGLQFLVDSQRVVYGLVDADAPRLHLRVLALHHQLPADVYHVVAHAFPVEQPSHAVHSESFGYGTAIQHRARVALDDFSVFKAYLFESHELAQAVDSQ